MVVKSINGELIKFKASDNLELQGMLCRSSKKTRKAIIHLHGMTGFFWDNAGIQLLKAAFQKNLAFFAFNNRGLGAINFLDKWGKKYQYIEAGTSFEKFEDCIKDIEAAIKILIKKGFNEFVLSGHSTGCQKITYYQSRKNNKAVKGLILLAPADDLNNQKRKLKNKFSKCLNLARMFIKRGKGNTFMPNICSEHYFTAKRYYEIFKPKSIEGSLFDYNRKLGAVLKIKCPILAIFGIDDHYAVIKPQKMLEKIKHSSKHKLSDVVLTKGNHSFRSGEKELIRAVTLWLQKVI